MPQTRLSRPLNTQENQGTGIQVGKASVGYKQMQTQASVDLNVNFQSEHQAYITEENKEVRSHMGQGTLKSYDA